MGDIEKAFEVVKRSDFLPEEVKADADLDVPLPIGFGQTNSQPTTVRLMLEWLDPQMGEKILDVGSGSGWTTALLSHLVGPKGKVHAVEREPELVRFGAENCKRIGLRNVEFHEAGGAYGLPEYAPYDRILVSAAAPYLPEELVGQLKIGGHMVIPVNNSVFEVTKHSGTSLDSIEHPGFAFVPLVAD